MQLPTGARGSQGEDRLLFSGQCSTPFWLCPCFSSPSQFTAWGIIQNGSLSDLNIMICPQSLHVAVFSLPLSKNILGCSVSAGFPTLFSNCFLILCFLPFPRHPHSPQATYPTLVPLTLTLHPNSHRKNKRDHQD